MNVLTEAEDLYVYSFKGPLGLRRGLSPIAIVGSHSEKDAARVIELCKREGIQVIRRGASAKEIGEMSSAVILDLTTPPDAKSLIKSSKGAKKTMVRRIRDLNYAPIGRVSAYEAMLSDKLFYRCKDCARNNDTACSGYCTTAVFYNGVETWSSKGRLLLIRGLISGELKPTEKLVDAIYTCTSCGLCYAQCVGTGELELHRAIEFARNKILEKGLEPEIFRTVTKNVVEKGRPFGLIRPMERMGWLKELVDVFLPRKAETLYWVGCMASYLLPNIAKSTVRTLTKAGVNFTVLGEEEGCCGLILVHSGAWREAKEIAVKNVKKLEEGGYKTLVAGCSGCYYAFRRIYPELFGLRLPLKILHISQLMEKLIKDGSLKLKGLNTKATWHDPCTLGRGCSVYESPRSVLRSIPELKFSEMPLNRGYGLCCGAGGGLWGFNRDLAMKIANSYLIENVFPSSVQTIVTGCPTCYMNLGRAAKRLQRTNRDLKIQVSDLAEIVEAALR